MSGEESSPSARPGEGEPVAGEVDAQELLAASVRAIAAARREEARLLGRSPHPRAESSEPGEQAEQAEAEPDDH